MTFIMMEEVEATKLKISGGHGPAEFKIRGILILMSIGGRYNLLSLLLLIG